MSFIAVTLQLLWSKLFLPCSMTSRARKWVSVLFGSPLTVLLILCFAAAVGVIAGIYPAFYLSSFQPVEVITKGARARGGRSLLRNGLVVFQFAVSIVLIIGTMVIFFSIELYPNTTTWLTKSSLLWLTGQMICPVRLKTFERNCEVIRTSWVWRIRPRFPAIREGWHLSMMGTAGYQYENLQNMWCDYDFAKTYRLNMAGGEIFFERTSVGCGAVVVNEEVRMAYSEKNCWR